LAYKGRFAPSPTGPLHAGSLVAALASWLDARSHGGQWLVRIEDVDTPRTAPGATERILQQLGACGLVSDGPVVLQSTRSPRYQQALDTLVESRLAYPCTCSRKDIAIAVQQRGLARPRHSELVYPGTCRPAHARQASTVLPTQPTGVGACAWRLRTEPLSAPDHANALPTTNIDWQDRRLGLQRQDVASAVGDFILKRGDGCFSYQLAVVVDDAAQGITHVVRGVDLADNTARQILLQCTLGLPRPSYLHVPLVLGPDGEKLSKQNGALAIDTATPQAALMALNRAALALGLPQTGHTGIADALATWIATWQADGRAA
jgi:glutamyl-Q tRNA(Asp) synthetase